ASAPMDAAGLLAKGLLGLPPPVVLEGRLQVDASPDREQTVELQKHIARPEVDDGVAGFDRERLRRECLDQADRRGVPPEEARQVGVAGFQRRKWHAVLRRRW